MRAGLARVFLTRTRDEWCAILEGTDACFAPVLTMQESIRHPHMQARNTYLELDGVTQPAPAPRSVARSPDQPIRPPLRRPKRGGARGLVGGEPAAELRGSGIIA